MSSTQIAASLRGALTPQSAGLALSGQWATVQAVAAHGADTVDVYLDNSAGGAGASVTTGLPYLDGYNPGVGDSVLVLAGQAGLQTSRVVVGPLAGNTSGPGNVGVPIGAMIPFPVTFTNPAWLLCNGGTFSSTTYPALYALLGATTLPDMRNVSPMGAGTTVALGATAGASTQTLTTAQLAAHNHGHNHAGPSHTHTGPSHTHTDSGHSHGHSHVDAPIHATGAGTTTTGTGVPPHNNTPAGSNFGSGSSDSTSGTASLSNSGTGATGSSGTGNTSTDSTSAGSGSAFSILSPVIGVAFYIRAL